MNVAMPATMRAAEDPLSDACITLFSQRSDEGSSTMVAEKQQVRVTVRVPSSLVAALERVANREERSLSGEIRLLMRRRVEAYELDEAA
jgi:hypothetical protein